MLKDAQPSEYFLGAILRGYDAEKAKSEQVTCSGIWDHVVIECMRQRGGFRFMFEWDKSKAQNINRIGTIAECIERGHVPGLALERTANGREVVVAGKWSVVA